MLLLALDTALEACSVAILDGERVVAARSEPMPRGHQERLAPLIDEMMRQAGLDFSNLDRIGVTVGPGSFTGLRVGLAFAKGLGFALGRPVVGVGTLRALAVSSASDGFAAAVIDARRDQVYVQGFVAGAPVTEPQALALKDAADLLIKVDPAGPTVLVGPGARLLADVFASAAVDERLGADPVALARLVAQEPEPAGAPEPLYLRAPDAKLPA